MSSLAAVKMQTQSVNCQTLVVCIMQNIKYIKVQANLRMIITFNVLTFIIIITVDVVVYFN